MSEPKFHVGQKVMLSSVNRRNTEEVEVVRVGRKLVQVDYHGSWWAFRIEDGRRNDDYHHEWIETPEEYWAREDRKITIERLKERGLEIRPGFDKHFRTDLIQMIVELIDEDQEDAEV